MPDVIGATFDVAEFTENAAIVRTQRIRPGYVTAEGNVTVHVAEQLKINEESVVVTE